jgi:hypothetical protein
VKYMLLIWEAGDPEAEVDPVLQQKEMEAYGAFTQEVVDRGLMRGGDPLAVPSTATTVRAQGDETLTTDGPFTETKEWLAGYYIVECKDLDEAIEIAAKIPAAAHGAIEVRPIMELPPEYASGS